MGVTYDATTDSHPSGTTASSNQNSFNWGLKTGLNTKAVVVFVLSNTNFNLASSVSVANNNDISASSTPVGLVEFTGPSISASVAAYFMNESFTNSLSQKSTMSFAKIPNYTYKNNITGLPANPTILTAAYGNKKWLTAVGTTIYKASNYMGSWSSVATITNKTIHALVYGNGYWVAMARDTSSGVGSIYYASDNDLATWTLVSGVSITTSVVRSTARYLNGYFVICAASSSFYYASDPTGTWSSPSGVFSSEDVSDIAYGGGYYGIVTSTRVLYTTDLTNSGAYTTSSNTETGKSIAYGNGYWVKATGGIKYTTNITTNSWSTPTTGNVANLNVVAYSNQNVAEGSDSTSGYFLAGGTNGVMRFGTGSAAGMDTLRTPTGAVGAGTINDITFGNKNDIEGRSWLVVQNITGAWYADSIYVNVVRINNATQVWGVAVSVSSDNTLEVFDGGTKTVSGTPAKISEELIDDGNFSLDTNRSSIRMAAFNTNSNAPSTAGANTTRTAVKDYGLRSCAVMVQTTAGQGSRPVGIGESVSGYDYAGVYLCIREVQTKRQLQLNGQIMLYNDGTGLKIVGRSV